MLAILLAVSLYAKADCGNTTVNTPFVYKSNANLVCALTGTLTFYANDLPISSDGSKFIINSTTLTITNLKKADIIKSYTCNNTTDLVVFNSQIAPYFYQVDSLSITSTESYSVEIACYLIVGSTSTQFYWQFNSVKLSSSLGKYSIVSDSTSTKLTINNLASTDPGYYYCYANNTYGLASRYTQLKVKSRLAPLYPFLGCVGQIIFLTVFLFCKWFFDKRDRQRLSKKTGATLNTQVDSTDCKKNNGKEMKRVNFKHEAVKKAETTNTYVTDVENDLSESKEL